MAVPERHKAGSETSGRASLAGNQKTYRKEKRTTDKPVRTRLAGHSEPDASRELASQGSENSQRCSRRESSTKNSPGVQDNHATPWPSAGPLAFVDECAGGSTQTPPPPCPIEGRTRPDKKQTPTILQYALSRRLL